MRKKTKKKIKKFFITIVLIGLLFLFTFFFNKELFQQLKDKIALEYNNVKQEIKDKLQIKDKEKEVIKIDSIDLDSDFMVFFLDVGQADSILIKSKDEFMLIDAGNNKDGKKIVNYFNTLGITNFKYVFGTHAHEDHIGGMDDIIKNFKIENFYMPDVTTTTASFLDVLNALEKKKVGFKTPVIDSIMPLGDATVETIYVGDKTKEDLNDTSIVLKVTYKDTSFLFTGDATSNVEREIANKNIRSTLLKVGHHGSKYSSNALFLTKVAPSYAVISCGKNNDYGHPHDVVVNKLEKIHAQIFRTDILGTIVVTSDGKELTFKNIYTNTDGDNYEKT